MKINFRQGIVSHQDGGFLQVNGATVDLLATNKPVTVTVAHRNTNYTHSEDNSVLHAWLGPFTETNYYLYWDFNHLTFERTFGKTTLEPVAQSVAPGAGNADIVGATSGDPGIGSFQVEGEYILPLNKPFTVVGSTYNNGSYTVLTATYSNTTGRTTIVANEAVPNSTADGAITLDIDSDGNPLYVEGRHWYDTTNHRHYVLEGTSWREVIRVFAAQLLNGVTFLSLSQNAGGGIFTGTQIGNNNSAFSGRTLFGESNNPIRRDDGTFFTTEDQFFTNQSRVDALRLESNVTRAQSIAGGSLAAFSVVAWTDNGQIDVAQYDDVGNTVVGLLTESLQYNEVGAVIVQGTVTNPAWDWLTGASPVSVGTELWVENGELTATDPNVSDPVTYPNERVPVARVLSSDTVIFEQGLGGVGPQGPQGTFEDLPPADTNNIGGVTLTSASSDPDRAFVISDTDFRLTNARTPTAHTHQASEVTYTPGGGVSSTNVQSAITELGTNKLNISGGTMTGQLSLTLSPTSSLHATNKQYVDNLVSGLIWLDPVDLTELVSDSVNDPPVSPEPGEAYIMTATPTGAWSAITPGNVVSWNGTTWVDRGAPSTLDANSRFGIAFSVSATASGSFLGRETDIAVFNGDSLVSFETPSVRNAVYVKNVASYNAFDQYAFDGTNWVLFSSGQNLTADNTTIEINSNVISAIPFTGSGGTIDARYWQGLEPSDLDSVYSQIGHSHNIPYDFGYYITGPVLADTNAGSFIVTRTVALDPAGRAANSEAYAENTAADGPYVLKINHVEPGVGTTQIGTITFSVGVNVGVVNIPSKVTLAKGDLLQIRTASGTPDSNLSEITITIVGCAVADDCSADLV